MLSNISIKKSSSLLIFQAFSLFLKDSEAKMMTNLFQLKSTLCLKAIFFAAITFITLSGFSQQNDERVLFIHIKNLTPDDYFKISNSFSSEGSIFIKQACVPAEVIMFGISPSNKLSLDDNYNAVKGVVLEKTNLTKVSILAEYSENDFLERCKMLRAGESENQ
jgi:hypothetical protein